MAKRRGLTPVTTEKDATRLPAWAQARVEVVPIALAWTGDAVLDRLLHAAVPPRETA
jgi:23S rRNA maturation mini-RNase III